MTIRVMDRQANFCTTHWSMVLASGCSESAETAKSLATLCQQYWPPLYTYVRHRGYSEHDAQDLTQAFFARLIEKNWLASADRSRGRFRTFLLTAFKHFLANEWDRKQTLKRGGGLKIVNMDSSIGMTIPDRKNVSAESLYERQWALAILETVLCRLKKEFTDAGRAIEYEWLKPHLTAPRNAGGYDALSLALGVQPVSARSAVHRLRKRFKELFREEVMHTLDRDDDIEDELRSVVAALGCLD
jgi:RNA polymerase sigma-70 factor (ECF subfamily)